MRQIYHFETQTPPALNETILRRERERRRRLRQTLLVVLADILLQAVLWLTAWITAAGNPGIAFGILCYSITSAAGSGIIVIIYTKLYIEQGGKFDGEY